jgi:hypothetical protein
MAISYFLSSSASLCIDIFQPTSSYEHSFLTENFQRAKSITMAPAVVSDIDLPPHEVPETALTAASKAPTFKLFSLEGKTIAITGGSRGLGITLAIAVVEAGGSVACLDILETPSADEWAKLTKLAKSIGVTATYYRCDVTDEALMESVLESVAVDAETLGAPFWGAIACAGIQQQIPAIDYPAADFERILKVNVTGVFNTCKYAARLLKEKKSPGSIVIISSMSGNVANRVSASSWVIAGKRSH